ncbi:MAG: hypothetical protein ABJD07_01865 [Gemmatimonadaceae bacterium]
MAIDPFVTTETVRPAVPDGRTAWVRARWLRARARNVRKQPLRIAIVGGGTFVIALIGFIVIPYGTRRSASPARSTVPLPSRADTVSPLARLGRIADSASAIGARLASARAQNARRSAMLRPPPDTFPAEVRARRDSLIAVRTTLGRLIVRAENAPLPASYRAIAAEPSIAENSRVRQLLDSLATFERRRADLNAVSGVDTVFMSLTSRVAAIGHEIQDVAASKLEAVRAEIARISPAQSSREGVPEVVDTEPLVGARGAVARGADATRAELVAARLQNRAADSAVDRRRQAAANVIPPLAMLVAALVLGGGAGFSVTLVREMLRPRVANAREAERATGAPVLARIRETTGSELDRRRADHDVSPLIDRVGDNYRAIYTQIADPTTRLAAVAVLGDDALTTAVIAVNIAAAAASQAPATLLVDADADHPQAANVLRVRPGPGLTDVAAARADWSETIAGALVGRDLTIDVLPSGYPDATADDRALAVTLRLELGHLRGRYDTVIVSAPVDRMAIATAAGEGAGGVVLVASVARTSMRALSARADALQSRGVPIRGVVLWDVDDPLLPSPQAWRAARNAGRGSRIAEKGV